MKTDVDVEEVVVTGDGLPIPICVAGDERSDVDEFEYNPFIMEENCVGIGVEEETGDI